MFCSTNSGVICLLTPITIINLLSSFTILLKSFPKNSVNIRAALGVIAILLGFKKFWIQDGILSSYILLLSNKTADLNNDL